MSDGQAEPAREVTAGDIVWINRMVFQAELALRLCDQRTAATTLRDMALHVLATFAEPEEEEAKPARRLDA